MAILVCSFGQTPGDEAAMPYDADTEALVLARKYREGGEGARDALLQALQKMGWSVRDAKGLMLKAAPAGADTGLAMRDYELEELLWKPNAQPTIRFISYAQAIAVPFQDADPEELAQDLVEVIRKSAASPQPQQRFWARFIVALGRVSPENYDLLNAAPPSVIAPSERQLKQLAKTVRQNPFAMLEATRPKPVWPGNDPVLAPSPRPQRDDDDTRTTKIKRDQKRSAEIASALNGLAGELSSSDEKRRMAAQEKMEALSAEMTMITMRTYAASMEQTARMKIRSQQSDDDEEDQDDADDGGSRFTAEWRDQPLSLLQIALITRVLAADLRLAATKGKTGVITSLAPSKGLPFAMILLAQMPSSGTSFGDQFSGAIGDIWATATGAYTGAVLDHYLPDNKFSKGVGIANVLIAWFKTIMSVARQNITIEVENAPLIRTKNRSPGQQRTARAKVAIDFPKSDVLKAVRAAANVTTVDLQLPDGGPVSGAKVVWRLPEGSYNTKYQTAKGGWEYRPDLAVVQFAQAGSKAAYVSTTNDQGEATITIEGVPQKKIIPPSVRPYPRRAVIAVEVTIKVGNLTQDMNDAINTAMGGPIGGGLSFIADMVLRTSFFFQKGRVFEVTDWKEPAWEGQFEITVKAAGSKREKGEKGGPDVDYTWKMDRYMEGRMRTPEWEEEIEQQKDYATDGRHKLEVDGDSRAFKLSDASSAKTRNSHNRYEAYGPIQIQPGGYNQLQMFSRAEPSGSAELVFTGGKMILTLKPFFGAECIVAQSEKNARRSSNSAGPKYLSLLDGVSPGDFTIIEDNDGSAEVVEGSKTFDNVGSLPFVPSFPATVTVKYRLWKNGPPPKNK